MRHIFQFQFLLYIKSSQDSSTAVYIEWVPNSTCGDIIIDMDNYLVSLWLTCYLACYFDVYKTKILERKKF